MQLQPIHTQLDSGTPIVLRPVIPEDKPLLEQGMNELSDRSRRLRFLTPTERLTRHQLAYLTEIDQHDHQAWGVLAGDEPIAIGRLVRISPDEGEVAITVVDEWQRQGLGQLLVRFLSVLAGEVGIRWLTFVGLPENAGLRSLLARFGVSGEVSEGLVTARLPVDQIEAPSFLDSIPVQRPAPSAGR